MSNVYKGGEQSIHTVPVASSTAIKVGDLVWLDTATGQCKPANAFTWTTDLATTQAAFAAKFLGVAVSQHFAGDSADTAIEVDTSPMSLWQTGCVASAFQVGDMLAPAQDGGNSLLSNTVLAKTATVACAIARSHNYLPNADVQIKVHYASAFDAASANKNAQIGA